MPNNPELDQSFENLSKTDLEELKLKTEIVKLRFEIQEKNKPWIVKNLGILIPSIIAVLTLGTGIWTGYFNVEGKRIENLIHDSKIEEKSLNDSIRAFTERKDNLHKKK